MVVVFDVVFDAAAAERLSFLKKIDRLSYTTAAQFARSVFDAKCVPRGVAGYTPLLRYDREYVVLVIVIRHHALCYRIADDLP